MIELLVVMVIISIILAFVLIAAMDAAHRAEERATQTLITKLEGGLNDRLDSLMQSRPEPNWSHAYMAVMYNSQFGGVTAPSNINLFKATERAQVFSWYDYLKRELPDVFFIQNDPSGNYPINFAGQQFPGTPTVPGAPANCSAAMLPLGNSMLNGQSIGGPYGDSFMSQINGSQVFISSTPTLGFTGAGIFGASYGNAAGLFKNLQVLLPTGGFGPCLPAGYDGVDNNSNNLIDEIGEGGWDLALLQSNHTHVTARSEVLYAVLVGGSGPWGSVFNPDEFTDREVQDTDGDGLPEFVDAWGQPLQFFRWPVLYHSDLQRGQVIQPDPTLVNTWDLLPPYQNFNSANTTVNAQGGSVFQERERDALDPNQQLTAIQWWAQTGVGGQFAANNNSPFASLPGPAASQAGCSGGVQAFEYFFHRLTEPIPPGQGASFWDRGVQHFPRRAYYSKFLVLSGGRDKQPGVFLYSDSDMQALSSSGNAASALICNENNALPFAMDLLGGGTAGFMNSVTVQSQSFQNTTGDALHPSSYDLQQAAQDDISNHNLQSVSGIGGSG